MFPGVKQRTIATGFLALLLALAMVALINSCGEEEEETKLTSSLVLSFPDYPDDSPLPDPTALDPAKALEVEGIKIWAVGPDDLPDLGLRQAMKATLTELDYDRLSLEIRVEDAPDTGWALLYINYDPLQLSVNRVEPGSFIGKREEVIDLIDTRRPGLLAVGIARIRPEETGVVRGSGLLVQIIFDRVDRTAPPLPRFNYPPGLVPRVEELSTEDRGDGSVVIAFKESFPADFNNNGLASLSDLPFLAAYYGERVDGKHGPAVQFMDINGDGILGEEELRALWESLYLRVDGYAIYQRGEASPLPPPAGSGVADLSLTLPRKRHNLKALERPTYRYVHEDAYDPKVALGRIPSYTVEVVDLYHRSGARASAGGTPGSLFRRRMPFWEGVRGIKSVAAGDGVIKVVIGRAVSPVDNPVGYRLYYADHPFRDIDSIPWVEVSRPVIYLGRDPEVPLVNGRTYYLLVVAYDKRFPKQMTTNRELTQVTLTDQAQVDLEPPRFEGKSVNKVIAGRGAVRLEPGKVYDRESGVAGFRVYYQPGLSVDPFTAQVVEFEPDEPIIIGHLTNGQTYTFLLTAFDRALPPNESQNFDPVRATPNIELPPLTPPRWMNPQLKGARAIAPVGDGITIWAYPGMQAEGTSTEGEVSYLVEYRSKNSKQWESLSSTTPDDLKVKGKAGTEISLRLRLADKYGNLSAPVELGTFRLREKSPQYQSYSFPPGSELEVGPGELLGTVELTVPQPLPPSNRKGLLADGYELVVYITPDRSTPPLLEPEVHRFTANQIDKIRSDESIKLDLAGLQPGKLYRFEVELISLFPKLSASLPSGRLTASFKLPLPVGEEGYLEGFSPPPKREE